MRGDILETFDLSVLRSEGEEGVERDEDQVKGALDIDVGEVS